MKSNWTRRRGRITISCQKAAPVDNLSAADRSLLMGRIGPKNSTPERRVRSALHRMGFRFRLHVRNLPGTPDIVLPRYRTVVFVHGCFWHRHNCRLATTPKTRPEFWMKKFAANQARDVRKRRDLEYLGWRVVEVWECETRAPEVLQSVLLRHFPDRKHR